LDAEHSKANADQVTDAAAAVGDVAASLSSTPIQNPAGFGSRASPRPSSPSPSPGPSQQTTFTVERNVAASAAGSSDLPGCTHPTDATIRPVCLQPSAGMQKLGHWGTWQRFVYVSDKFCWQQRLSTGVICSMCTYHLQSMPQQPSAVSMYGPAWAGPALSSTYLIYIQLHVHVAESHWTLLATLLLQ
jgi:hypothetical protein